MPEQKGNVDNAQNQFVSVSHGGRSTRIHAVVDGLGNPCVLMLTRGQVHDSVTMKPALDQLDISQSVFLADKAYGWVNPRFCANSIYGANRAKLVQGGSRVNPAAVLTTA